MEKYVLKPSVEIEFKNNELYIIDRETGFVGTGNKSSYNVLVLMKEEKTQEEVMNALKAQYGDGQFHRIAKSIPKIFDWAIERDLFKKIS